MGQVHGVAGGSLVGARWAASTAVAQYGASGERATAKVLDVLARTTGVTVLHDLRIPGLDANLDHVVVAGRKVTVIESKCWKPGWYVTLLGDTFRVVDGRPERFAHADRCGVPAGLDRLHIWLTARGVPADIARTAVEVVWPSSPRGTVHLGLAALPSARAVTGGKFTVRRARRLCGTRTADPAVVAALLPLLNDGGR